MRVAFFFCTKEICDGKKTQRAHSLCFIFLTQLNFAFLWLDELRHNELGEGTSEPPGPGRWQVRWHVAGAYPETCGWFSIVKAENILQWLRRFQDQPSAAPDPMLIIFDVFGAILFVYFVVGVSPLLLPPCVTPSQGVTCRSRGRISEHRRDPSETLLSGVQFQRHSRAAH